MEQSLLDKFHNGTCDDIDKAMIVTRVKKALGDVLKVLAEFSKKYEEVTKDKEDELKMAGFACIVGVSDHLIHDGEVGLQIVTDDPDDVENIFNELKNTVSEYDTAKEKQ